MGKSMPKQVNIWAPILKGDRKRTMSLAVRCGEKAPNKDTYRMYLQDHLDTKILSNPKRSREEVQAMGSTCEYPIPELSVHSDRVPTPPVGSADITARRDGDVALSDRLAEGQSASKPVRQEPAKPDGRIANAVDDDKANALADESNQF
jgi:hypothetical protein